MSQKTGNAVFGTINKKQKNMWVLDSSYTGTSKVEKELMNLECTVNSLKDRHLWDRQ